MSSIKPHTILRPSWCTALRAARDRAGQARQNRKPQPLTLSTCDAKWHARYVPSLQRENDGLHVVAGWLTCLPFPGLPRNRLKGRRARGMMDAILRNDTTTIATCRRHPLLPQPFILAGFWPTLLSAQRMLLLMSWTEDSLPPPESLSQAAGSPQQWAAGITVEQLPCVLSTQDAE
ncbi:hypothetical protein RB213_002564 [Colletotrichum asianum]